MTPALLPKVDPTASVDSRALAALEYLAGLGSSKPPDGAGDPKLWSECLISTAWQEQATVRTGNHSDLPETPESLGPAPNASGPVAARAPQWAKIAVMGASEGSGQAAWAGHVHKVLPSLRHKRTLLPVQRRCSHRVEVGVNIVYFESLKDLIFFCLGA